MRGEIFDARQKVEENTKRKWLEKYVGLSKKFQNMHDKCYNCHRYKIANESEGIKKCQALF